MVKEKMARAMIEPLVNKTMRDMQKDPERTLRNIIDLLLSFPNGRFSNNLFQIAQKMLTDEKSAYYILIKKIVDYVNLDNLKIFSLNVGYNACTFGAKKIRGNIKAYNCKIPWVLFIKTDTTPQSSDNVSRIINEAKQLGIYMFSLFGKNVVSDSMRHIYEENSDCAFVLFTNAECIQDDVVSKYIDINNILISVNNDDNTNVSEAIEILRKYKKFYAAHIHYSNENASEVLSDDKLKDLENYSASFVFCVPNKECTQETFEYFKNATRKIRDNQKYSYVIMDAYDDITIIDKMISGNSCEMGILEDGTFVVSENVIKKTNFNINNMSLIDIVKNFKI
ncbi:MAG: hypothetical protein VB119_05365 [Candidatus Metalachnospira sp.]|nr:hypothetical protein [Candidatus Metalachnospira sp.]